MLRPALTLPAIWLALPSLALAQSKDQKIESASSAAPASVSANATVMDWDRSVLREGTNGWTCLPDVPNTSENDPMCLDEPWVNWLHAWMNKQQPTYSRMGFGYMLQGSSPASNTDPYAEGPTPDNEWLDRSMPHIMVIVPDAKALEGLPTNPDRGGAWVMWRGTPYVHIMIPTPKKGM
jgi:hypothetical protein